MSLRYSAIAIFLLMAPLAQAHYPVMDCERDGDQIECRVGFSDGTLAIGSEVVMYAYDESVMARAESDRQSRVLFDWSDEKFYIQFDAGHEDPAEFDYVEF